MFGSHNDAAISLTEWATRPNSYGPFDTSLSPTNAQDLRPGISGSTVSSFLSVAHDNTVNNTTDITLAVQGDPFVRLSADGTHLNPYLAGLFKMESSDPSLIASSDLSKATTVSSLYSFGNHPSPGNSSYGSYSGIDPGVRFPLSFKGTFVGEGMRQAYLALSAQLGKIDNGQITQSKTGLAYTQKEKDSMNRSVLILFDGADGSTVPETQA